MVVNNYAQYCSIVKTGIGNVTMILGGEVDAGKSTRFTAYFPSDWHQFGMLSLQMAAL